ncbi:MAG: trigger factor [Candidatus Dormibacteria bacterium]
MQVNVTHRPGSVVQLEIEVPAEQVDRAVERAFNRLAGQVRVQGFRPGRAPRPVLERTIGWDNLRSHAIDTLVPDALAVAITEQKLIAIATPEVSEVVLERSQPARIVALVPVKPVVKLPDYRAIKAPLGDVVVDSAKVDQSLQELRESFAILVPADNRPAQAGDQLVVDLEVHHEGTPVDAEPATDIELEMNEESLLPGLFAGVVGTSTGETRDLDLTLPEDYRRADLAGKHVVFKVTVKAIKERQLPEVDDELARNAGAGETLLELRNKLEERLKAATERDAVFAQQKAALDALIAGADFEMSEALVEQDLDREIRNLAIQLGQQGIDFDQFIKYGGADIQQLRDERRSTAEDRVRQELVLDALADAEGLEPSGEHIIAEARNSLGGAPDSKQLMNSERVQAYVRERLRLQWALLWLAASARGDHWTVPAPAEVVVDADHYAAEEILEQEMGSNQPASIILPGSATVAAAPEPEAGTMVDI